MNERKEDVPGSIELQVIERKWEPCMCVCACVYLCAFLVTLQAYTRCIVVLHKCAESVTVFLAAVLISRFVLTRLESSTGSIFRRAGAVCCKQALKSVNKEKKWRKQQGCGKTRWNPQHNYHNKDGPRDKEIIHFSHSEVKHVFNQSSYH